jgi:anti-sigma regulatory factor (Ser/Thr protein kinase)
MNGTTSHVHQPAANRYPRRALSQAALVSCGRSSGQVADVARGAPFAAGWPLQSFLELGALSGAVPCARLHARQVLGEWGLAGFSEATELLVFELVTNATRISGASAQDTPVRLWVVSDKAQVVVLVWGREPVAAGTRRCRRGRGDRARPDAGGRPQHAVGLALPAWPGRESRLGAEHLE